MIKLKVLFLQCSLLCALLCAGLGDALAQDFKIYTYGNGSSTKGPTITPRDSYYPKGYLFRYGRKKTSGGPSAVPGLGHFYKKGYIAKYGEKKLSSGPSLDDGKQKTDDFNIYSYGRGRWKKGPRYYPIERYYPDDYIAEYGRKKTLEGPQIVLPKKQKEMHPSAYHLNSKHKDSFKQARRYRKRKNKRLKGSDAATPDSQALEKIKEPKRMGSESQIWD